MPPGDTTVDARMDLYCPHPNPSLPSSRGFSALAELASLEQLGLNVCGWPVARLLACHSAG